MKSILSLMSLCLMTTAVGVAQTQYYYGDVNHDNRLTVADVTKLIETQDTPERIVVQDGAIVQGGPVQSVTMKQSVQSISRDQYIYVWSSTEPAGATFWNVVWDSSNPEVATVDAYGKATAQAMGTTTISCRNKANNQLLASCTLNVTDYVVYFGCPNYQGVGDIPLGLEKPNGEVDATYATFNYIYVRDDVGSMIVEHNSSDNFKIDLPVDCKKDIYLLVPWPIVNNFEASQQDWGKSNIWLSWNQGNYEHPSTGCFMINGLLYLRYTIDKGYMEEYDRYVKIGHMADYQTKTKEKKISDFYYGDINHDGVVSQKDIELLTNQILTDEIPLAVSATDVQQGAVIATGITLDNATLSVGAGFSAKLNAVFTPAFPTDTYCTWTSSNTNVATVDGNGKVTGKGTGTATITVEPRCNPDIKATCVAKVTIVATSVSLDQTSLTLPIGYTETLTASLLPANVADPSCQWTSTAPTVASVDANGKVTALKAGQATITVTPLSNPAISASCQVTVQYVAPQSISLNQSSITLEKGRSRTLTATVLPETTTDKTCQWSSSDTSVATVDADGKITALKEGTVTITATSNAAPSLKAICTVKVTPSAGIDNSYGEGDDFIWGN